MDGSSEEPGSARLGEVIETSTVRVLVESDHLHELPALGAVVSVSIPSGDPILAVVSFGETAGIDTTRRAIRRGSDEVRDGEVYRRHPELTQILRTTFEARPVAYWRRGAISQTLPPLPPPLHYSVRMVTDGELHALTDVPRYLSTLAAVQGDVPVDQLMVAHLRWVSDNRPDGPAWLEYAAKEVARIFKDDYDRLVPLLEALDPRV